MLRLVSLAGSCLVSLLASLIPPGSSPLSSLQPQDLPRPRHPAQPGLQARGVSALGLLSLGRAPAPRPGRLSGPRPPPPPGQFPDWDLFIRTRNTQQMVELARFYICKYYPDRSETTLR